jgi:hypothetical protein
VFKVKRNEHGAVVKYKARLVVKGYAQRRGIDYDEVFAPVARLDKMRLLIALAAHRGWEVHHLDVKSAFLSGDMLDEMFVEQPAGFIKKGSEGKVPKLKKALYGLHQAPRARNAKLDDTLTKLGFTRSPYEPSIYTRNTGQCQLVVGVYVDDLLNTGTDNGDIRKFKEEMLAAFKMSDMGILRYYLGIEVDQTPDGITLSQGAYAQKILEKTRMASCSSRQTPMENKLNLSKNSTQPLVDATRYRSTVGSLRYLVNTILDLAFAVGYVSRFLSEPHEDHMLVVKHILRYVVGTVNWGLQFKKGLGGLALSSFTDIDYVGDVDSRKSTSGVFFFLYGNPVPWQSSKQSVVPQSSCEAEYMTAANGACQALWLRRVLEELEGLGPNIRSLMVDNCSAVALIKNLALCGKSKHIEVKYHLVRECAEQRMLEVREVRTQDQLGDILMKALGRLKFQEMRARIGMVDVGDQHGQV